MSARVIVTGAASGIGAETVRQLRARGARVVGLDRTPGEGIVACDVREQASVDEAVAAGIAELGGLDAVVNCAGIGTPQSAAAVPDDGALAVLDINLLGPWRVTGAAMPALRESHGRVVNVASGLAHLTVPYGPAYCMSKRGIVAYSDALRLEVGHEIDVCTVYPGYVRTPIHDASAAVGFSLEGMVPVEPLPAVAARLVAATLDPPVRDLATTRQGTANYALLRLLPRRLVDRGITLAVRRQARKGTMDAGGLAGPLVRHLRG